MLKHKHSPASKVSHCYSWVISSCISTSWLTHFKGELQCQMLFIQIQFVSSLRKPVFYSCRSIFMFFLFLCIIAVANSKENKKKNPQHWPGNNYLTVWSMFVCFWKCVHICFCAFACAVYECGSWQFTSLGSVLIRRSQCYLSVLAAISLLKSSNHGIVTRMRSFMFSSPQFEILTQKFNSDALQPLEADKRGSTEGLEDL